MNSIKSNYENIFLRKEYDVSLEYKCLNISITIILCIVLLIPIVINIFMYNSCHDLNIKSFQCFNKKIINKPCNFCGITRSILTLYNGDIVTSIKYNVGGLLFVIFCIIQVMLRFLFYKAKWRFSIFLDLLQSCILWMVFIQLVNLWEHG